MSAPTIATVSPASKFIGTPAVYQFSPTGAGVGKSFYQLKVKLVSGIGNSDPADFFFSLPIETRMVNNVATAQPVSLDVSSALRAVAEQWQPEPPVTLPDNYPAVSFFMEAHEEWLIEGITYTSDTARYPGSTGNVYMYMGALTDRERLTGERPAKYGRKPSSSPEICFIGSRVIVPGTTANDAPPSIIHCVAGEPEDEEVFSTLNYYAVNRPADGYEIRFINSLGVHENIFAYGLPTKDVHITTEQYVIARQETLSQFSRGLAIKKNDYETWSLSSGPVDEQWASWFIHEFLMLRFIWIKVNDQWLPCHVIPEDTISLTDRINPTRHEVRFKLQLDINGSPL